MMLYKNNLIKLLIVGVSLLSIKPTYASTEDMVKALQFYTQNHELLAKNISNSDTPGYQAIEAEDVKNYMQASQHKAVSLVATHNNHLVGKQRSAIRIRKQRDTYETKPNGNNVSIRQQMQKIAKNQLNHRAIHEVLSKTNKVMLNALGKNG